MPRDTRAYKQLDNRVWPTNSDWQVRFASDVASYEEEEDETDGESEDTAYAVVCTNGDGGAKRRKICEPVDYDDL